jgi:hypothetical protein
MKFEVIGIRCYIEYMCSSRKRFGENQICIGSSQHIRLVPPQTLFISTRAGNITVVLVSCSGQAYDREQVRPEGYPIEGKTHQLVGMRAEITGGNELLY